MGLAKQEHRDRTVLLREVHLLERSLHGAHRGQSRPPSVLAQALNHLTSDTVRIVPPRTLPKHLLHNSLELAPKLRLGCAMSDAPVKRDANGHLLPGSRLNPGGRPRGVIEEVRERLGPHTPEFVDALGCVGIAVDDDLTECNGHFTGRGVKI